MSAYKDPRRLTLELQQLPVDGTICEACGGPCVEFVCAVCERIAPLTPVQVVETLRALPIWRFDAIFAMLSGYVCEARLRNGGRILDASDFKQWLEELAEEAKQQ